MIPRPSSWRTRAVVQPRTPAASEILQNLSLTAITIPLVFTEPQLMSILCVVLLHGRHPAKDGHSETSLTPFFPRFSVPRSAKELGDKKEFGIVGDLTGTTTDAKRPAESGA